MPVAELEVVRLAYCRLVLDIHLLVWMNSWRDTGWHLQHDSTNAMQIATKALYNFYVVNAYNSSCSENKRGHEYSKHTEFFIVAPGFSDSCLRSSPPGKDHCPQIITMQTNSAPCQSAASNGRGLFPGISTARTGAHTAATGRLWLCSRGGKCGDQFSPRSCATQYHKAVSCAIHSFTEAHTKPLFAHSESQYVCRMGSCWHDHRVARAFTKKAKATAAIGVLGDVHVGEVSGNSILKTNYSFKHTQKQKCAKLL